MAKLNETQIQAIKFTLLSISAGVVEAASFAVLEWLAPGWAYWVKHAISLTLSVLYNFTLNRRYTFKSAGNVPKAMLLVALFYALFIPASSWWGNALAQLGWLDWVIKIFTMIINFIGEFLWWKFVVFRGTENTNALAH